MQLQVKNEGVGLAAPQLGELERMFLMASFPDGMADSDEWEYKVVVNPSYKVLDKDIGYDFEGCLSIPG